MMRTLLGLFVFSFFLASLASAESRLYVFQEGNDRSESELFVPCEDSGKPMEERKKARNSAIEQGFKGGGCIGTTLGEGNLDEIAVTFMIGAKGVYYLTPDQIERLRGYAKERGEDFVTSESMPL